MVTERKGQRGRNGTGNGERGGRRKRGGQRGPETKRRPLVEDMSEYRYFYEGRVLIRFVTYNIRNRRNKGLESVLRGVS